MSAAGNMREIRHFPRLLAYLLRYAMKDRRYKEVILEDMMFHRRMAIATFVTAATLTLAPTQISAQSGIPDGLKFDPIYMPFVFKSSPMTERTASSPVGFDVLICQIALSDNNIVFPDKILREDVLS